MNSGLFVFHIFLVTLFVLGALRLGKQALVACIAISWIFSNLFVVKQMDLFGLTVTCSDVFAVGGILGLNLLQEHFGKDEAEKAIRVSFFGLIFFGVMVAFHMAYMPSARDTAHDAFSVIFASTPRLVITSFLVYYVVQRWDVYFFHYLSRIFAEKWLVLRLWISLFVSQALDTILFSVLGLYGLVDSLFDVIMVSYVVKCCIIVAAVPLVAFSKNFRDSLG